MNIFVQFFWGTYVFLFLLSKYLGVELCLVVKKPLDLFSKVFVPFYTSQQCVRVPVALHSYQGFLLSGILLLSIFNGWFVVFKVLICISLMIIGVEHFFVCVLIGHLCISLSKVSLQTFAHIILNLSFYY